MEKDVNESEGKKTNNSWWDYFQLGEVANYFFRKKNPDRPSNINIKIMHGINRIAIIIFLAAIIFFILKKILS